MMLNIPRMRPTLWLFSACLSVLMLFGSAANAGNTHQENKVKASALTGSWQLVSGQYLDDKAQWVDYQSLHLSAIKVIVAGHFSFTTMKTVAGESTFWAAGAGRFEDNGHEYKEIIELNSFGVATGTEFVFRYQLKGEQWHTKRFEQGELKEVEVWQKLSDSTQLNVNLNR